jgi:hypothetical protein
MSEIQRLQEQATAKMQKVRDLMRAPHEEAA